MVTSSNRFRDLLRAKALISPELERLVYELLTKEADDRFQTATEVRERVQAIIGNYSFVPWAQGPTLGGMNINPNLSKPGFLNSFGGQTIPPAQFAGSSRTGIKGASGPLVGRNIQRRQIESAIRETVRGTHSNFVTLEGERGIGKTRLIEWLGVRIEESGLMRHLSGIYRQSSGGFDGIRSVLEQLLGTDDVSYDDLDLTVRSKLRRWDFSNDEMDALLLRPERSLFIEANEDGGLLQERCCGCGANFTFCFRENHC